MNTSEILRYRLSNQHISGTELRTPQEMVSWFLAMQAQEYAQAKWSIGLRIPGLNDAEVENAFNEGEILRTHLMRPTWHFVSPADIRWLLELTAPRVKAVSASMYRKLELDDALFKRINKIFTKALEGGKHLTRNDLKTILAQKKIQADGIRMGLIMMYAELEGVVCSGPRRANQFTYALLEERVPASQIFVKEEALAEISNRYFSSRGPATLRDFVWWSGLTVKDARSGIAALGSHFIKESINGQEFIFPSVKPAKLNSNSTFLMSDYDEYGIAYKDRSILHHPANIPGEKRYAKGIWYHHFLLIDGQIGGIWETSQKGRAEVKATPFIPILRIQQDAIKAAVKRYNSFHE